MRCDRFRADMMKTPMAARTRAERALFARHTKNCVACWNWLLEMCQRYGGSTARNLSYSKKMLEDDNKDQEFLAVINSPEIIE